MRLSNQLPSLSTEARQSLVAPMTSQLSTKRSKCRAFSLVVAVLLFYLIYNLKMYPPVLSAIERYGKPSPAPYKALNVNLLESYTLSKDIEYTRIDITVFSSRTAQEISDEFDAPLPPFRIIDLYESQGVRQSDEWEEPHLEVYVPHQESTYDASHIIFGIATTYERLRESLCTIAHWAGPSHARIAAILERQSTNDTAKLEQRASELGFTLEVAESDDSFDDRYFSLVKLLFERRGPKTEWTAIIDDDTFFPSMPALLAQLKTHDASEPIYLGGVSEDIYQIRQWNLMAFGGAGVFLTVPLLQLINPHHQTCYDEHQWSGDRRIAHCIYIHTTIKLTIAHNLRQLDLHGDPSGFYESGRTQPLSLHHWKSWAHIDMEKMAAVSAICGDACLLHRWRFSDGWYLNNGFSLVKYSDGYESSSSQSSSSFKSAKNSVSSPIEKTWDDWENADDDSYIHALAPLRPKDEGKITYRLKDVFVEEGQVRQIYARSLKPVRQNSIVEVVWRAA